MNTFLARSQPSGNGERSFSSQFGPFSGFENWTSYCCGQSSSLHGKLVYSILFILFQRRTIFKMLALEQSAKSGLLAPVGGRPTGPTLFPLGYGPYTISGNTMPLTSGDVVYSYTHCCRRQWLWAWGFVNCLTLNVSTSVSFVLVIFFHFIW